MTLREGATATRPTAVFSGAGVFPMDETKQGAWMAVDWLVRAFAPAFLRAAGGQLAAVHAPALSALPTIGGSDTADAVEPTIAAASSAALAAAGNAAWSVAHEPFADTVWLVGQSAARIAVLTAGAEAARTAASATGYGGARAADAAVRIARWAATVAAVAAAADGARRGEEDHAWKAARRALDAVTRELQCRAPEQLAGLTHECEALRSP